MNGFDFFQKLILVLLKTSVEKVENHSDKVRVVSHRLEGKHFLFKLADLMVESLLANKEEE